ncbi:hypothetical protein QLS91_12970 [Flavobacterium sp. LB2P84]|uniref:hypothetical protein n=1 Tax=Flavobacterium yafengii TaxID=3041253 RepID=UPI0024A99DF5|nr:hypothetical protein [Flavobacterium yafengii]MDI6033986.1 hypothetical protein [Flavobacterium yafengii]
MADLINEVCGTDAASQPKNLGGKKQCIEGAVLTGFLAKNDFSFDSAADAKDPVKVKAAIAAKNIKALPEFETVEDENTEATTVEKRRKTIISKQGVAGSKYGIDASMCTYAALKTYQDSDYTRIFEITDADDEEMTCDIDESGKVFGRKLTSTIVGLRTRTSLENDASVPLSLKFAKDTYDIIRTDSVPGNKYADFEDIFDIEFEIVGTPTATLIKFKALSGCSGRLIKSLESGNVVLKNGAGAVQTVTFTPPNTDGVYELVGTAFANGFTLSTNGVVAKDEANYEAPIALTISGIV